MAEAGRQVRLHREHVARSIAHGLWRQGRGWTEEDPSALVAGRVVARDKGWVLRGLTDALEVTPPEQPSARILQHEPG
jgi:rhamnogalacturonyl hydrolase YesR